MARSRLLLHEILKAITGPEEVYFQAPTSLEYPCIKYELDEEFVAQADNLVYYDKNRYLVTVIDRDPDSQIPSQVRALPYSNMDRKFVKDNLHHFVYNLYF